MDSRTAILYLTHRWEPVHARRFGRLREETRTLGDSFVLMQSSARDAAHEAAGMAFLSVFDPAALPAALGYPYLTKRGIVPGCTHYPLIDFARKHEYDHYWLIENDVEFSGNWSRLIGACARDQADLVAAHVMRHEADPAWIWWRYIAAPRQRPLDVSRLLRAFFPVYRISRKALLHVDRMHRAGWRGHYEALVPTLLSAAGMSVRDFRQFGQFYLGSRQDPPHMHGRPDQLSTLRWRPPVTRDEFTHRFSDNVIFHPVKQAWTFNGESIDHVGMNRATEKLK